MNDMGLVFFLTLTFLFCMWGHSILHQPSMHYACCLVAKRDTLAHQYTPPQAFGSKMCLILPSLLTTSSKIAIKQEYYRRRMAHLLHVLDGQAAFLCFVYWFDSVLAEGNILNILAYSESHTLCKSSDPADK